MRVETVHDGAAAVVHLAGRLDAEWASHLALTLDELLRVGMRSVVIDMAGVTYASSAAAAAVTRASRDFAAVRGELLIAAPPHPLRAALDVAGMAEHLLPALPSGSGGEPRVRAPVFGRNSQTLEWRAPALHAGHGRYELVPRAAGAALACRLLPPRATAPRDHAVAFPDGAFGLGLGAIADGGEAGPRAGELVAAGGAVIYRPTDGASIPDWQVAVGEEAPRALLREGIACAGDFSHLVRFGPAHEGTPVPLDELADVCLDAVGADVAGIVVVAEVGGLVGAWRQRAPDAAGGSSFEPGAVRDWLTFTAEPALGGTAALVAGIVARAGRPTATPAALMAQLRPLHPAASLVGHLHAAAFTYRHVPRRTATVASVVGGLLRDETPRGVLHLLYDARVESALARQSTLVRGLAWAAPVRSVEVEP